MIYFFLVYVFLSDISYFNLGLSSFLNIFFMDNESQIHEQKIEQNQKTNCDRYYLILI